MRVCDCICVECEASHTCASHATVRAPNSRNYIAPRTCFHRMKQNRINVDSLSYWFKDKSENNKLTHTISLTLVTHNR